MEKKVLRYMKAHHMTAPGDRVLVGLSGGADSVCLLHLVLEFGIPAEAVHINHCLRGSESDGDEAFVRDLCEKLQVPLTVERHEVKALASARKQGLEETGRAVRREVFERIRKEHGLQKIALAHHAGDQAETLLFRAARGTSIAGMAGIRPVEGFLIRPLLGTAREEIEEWLDSRGIRWRTDSTNLSDRYSRNSIRMHVIPRLKEDINPAAVMHLCALAEDMAEADAFLREEAGRLRSVVVRDKDGLLLPEKFSSLPGILRRYLILDAVAEAAGSRKDLGREQIRQVEDLFSMQAGREYFLPGEVLAVREYRGVRLTKADRTAPVPGQEAVRIEDKEEASYHLGSWSFSCRLFSLQDGADTDKIPRNRYTKWLDYDKINHNLELRFRRYGDYMVTTSSGGRKKLKDYLIDEKVPRRQRDSLPVLASGQEIFWVIGMRISERARITAETCRVLEIKAIQTGGET